MGRIICLPSDKVRVNIGPALAPIMQSFISFHLLPIIIRIELAPSHPLATLGHPIPSQPASRAQSATNLVPRFLSSECTDVDGSGWRDRAQLTAPFAQPSPPQPTPAQLSPAQAPWSLFAHLASPPPILPCLHPICLVKRKWGNWFMGRIRTVMDRNRSLVTHHVFQIPLKVCWSGVRLEEGKT